MKRALVHALFGAVALGFTVLAAIEALDGHRAETLNQAVARVAAGPIDGHDERTGDNGLPELRFARARALAAAGRHDAAVKQYSALIQASSPPGLRQAALYNLANLYLRQSAAAEAGPSLVVMALAKQRYRDLLRMDPLDWDARYNLERALRMAPEDEATFPAVSAEPAERRQVRMRGMAAGDLP
ncbi:MxaK protein [Aquabacterium sp.]|uniref:MxaK protein n=1 Tax=Aquabacterium sp. TaxID=1872578 RepID=UPI002BF80C8C|nr:MxaK protein [Aquabacterium sp.]HSW06557.1 MxaK protein [Aquabacterium sp.]